MLQRAHPALVVPDGRGVQAGSCCCATSLELGADARLQAITAGLTLVFLAATHLADPGVLPTNSFKGALLRETAACSGVSSAGH